jgi:hypothetical protein
MKNKDERIPEANVRQALQFLMMGLAKYLNEIGAASSPRTPEQHAGPYYTDIKYFYETADRILDEGIDWIADDKEKKTI